MENGFSNPQHLVPNDSRRETIGLVIADDHPVMLRGLVSLCEHCPDMHVLAQASDGQRLFDALDRVAADVVVTGWQMPYLSGADVLKLLHQRADAPPVVVYSGTADPGIPKQAMALGAAGFCSKRDDPSRLLEMVRAVARGHTNLLSADPHRAFNNPLARLSAREREILASLVRGLTSKQIASELSISCNTVKFHLKNVYSKLNATNRAQAVAIYMAGF